MTEAAVGSCGVAAVAAETEAEEREEVVGEVGCCLAVRARLWRLLQRLVDAARAVQRRS
jgi:hypothetical protein